MSCLRDMSLWLAEQGSGFTFTSEMIRSAVFTGRVKPDRETVRINLARMEDLGIIRRVGKVHRGAPGARFIIWTVTR